MSSTHDSPGAGAGGGASGVGSGAAAGATAGTGSETAHITPRVWQMTDKLTASEPGANVTPSQQEYFLDLTKSTPDQDFPAKIADTGSSQDVTAHLDHDDYAISGARNFTVHGIDTDGDGEVDTLSGTSSGMVRVGGGDVVYSYPVDIAISGVPDVTPPRLFLPTDPISPVSLLQALTSEPMQAPVSLTLIGTSTVGLTWQPPASLGENTVLPLGGTWAVSGTGKDLSGNSLVLDGTLKTIADPGVFPEDGFEGDLVAAIEAGSPQAVSGIGSAPAIDGAKSLLVGSGDAITFHLHGRAGVTALSFSARILGAQKDASIIDTTVPLTVGVIGGGLLDSTNQLPSNSTSATVDTGDATWPKASAVQPFRCALPKMTGDVLVRFTAGYDTHSDTPLPRALLIDDLKLE